MAPRPAKPASAIFSFFFPFPSPLDPSLLTADLSMYPLARAALFRLDAERAHHLTLDALGVYGRLPLRRDPLPGRRVEAMGLTFANPIGLGAGLDKDATAIDGLGSLGFGFLEVGTLTPRPQPGNPQPRLFRLKPQRALINRMGFNNHGIAEAIPRLAARRYRGVLGVNLGKNKDTPNERALDDYLPALEAAAPHADYLTVNLSSPNTPQLRALLEPAALRALLQPLLARRAELARELDRPLPLLVKIAPDHEPAQLDELAGVFNELGPQGVIATNTTLDRGGVEDSPLAGEAGGLSGAPLNGRAQRTLEAIRPKLDPAISLVASGGIMTGADARRRLDAGAALVQLYTGFIYAGPALVKQCIAATGS